MEIITCTYRNIPKWFTSMPPPSLWPGGKTWPCRLVRPHGYTPCPKRTPESSVSEWQGKILYPRAALELPSPRRSVSSPDRPRDGPREGSCQSSPHHRLGSPCSVYKRGIRQAKRTLFESWWSCTLNAGTDWKPLGCFYKPENSTILTECSVSDKQPMLSEGHMIIPCPRHF